MHSTLPIFVEYRAARHSQTENEIFVCLCTLLLLYLYNVGCDSVEPSWKYDFLLSLHSTFTIFVEYRMRFGRVKSEMRFPFAFALTFLYICLKLNNCRYALFFDHNSGI